MSNFYFTYGSEGQPFVGGWTVISAPDRQTACAVFRAFHPDRTDGLLNCSTVYSEEEFLRTKMVDEGNFHRWAHEIITVTQQVLTNERSNTDD